MSEAGLDHGGLTKELLEQGLAAALNPKCAKMCLLPVVACVCMRVQKHTVYGLLEVAHKSALAAVCTVTGFAHAHLTRSFYSCVCLFAPPPPPATACLRWRPAAASHSPRPPPRRCPRASRCWSSQVGRSAACAEASIELAVACCLPPAHAASWLHGQLCRSSNTSCDCSGHLSPPLPPKACWLVPCWICLHYVRP